jgi:hypothetical protein
MESTLSAFFDGIPESPASPFVFVIGIVVLIEPFPTVFGPPQRIRLGSATMSRRGSCRCNWWPWIDLWRGASCDRVTSSHRTRRTYGPARTVTRMAVRS